ncbi:MAG: methionyl-tRNA formyltransferase [Smithellaceae bacterium]|nr:methionyl-tRNA formyltransferase [Smithellaceae bacterium]
MEKPKILFMGTPEFALAPLAALVKGGYALAGVVTRPDRPQGRGKLIAHSPVKAFALAHGLPVFQPERVASAEFLPLLAELSPQLIVVAAFGQILPRAILQAPPLGCFNIHPSLLPKYRGAAPINRAIMAGDRVTGVTIMAMDEGLDSGDILLQEELPIYPDETYGSLHDRLARLGGDLLLKTIDLAISGDLKPLPQDHGQATLAPKVCKEECLINWSGTVKQVTDLIRGISPSPGAHTLVGGKLLKIIQAEGLAAPVKDPPGAVILTDQGISVAVADGYVLLKILQWENRKALPVREFKSGFRVPPGTVLG